MGSKIKPSVSLLVRSLLFSLLPVSESVHDNKVYRQKDRKYNYGGNGLLSLLSDSLKAAGTCDEANSV